MFVNPNQVIFDTYQKFPFDYQRYLILEKSSLQSFQNKTHLSKVKEELNLSLLNNFLEEINCYFEC